MNLVKRALGAAIGWVLLAGTASAACNITVGDITSTTWMGGNGVGYDIYDSQRRIQLVNFRVRSHDGGCPYYLTVSPATGSGDGTGYLMGGGGEIRFGIYKDANGSQPLRPAGLAVETDMYLGVVPAGGTIINQLVLTIPPEQVVAPGFYSGDVEFTLYEGVFGSGVVRDRRRVTVSVQVPSVAQVSFAEGTGFDANHGSHTVLFGRLRERDRRVVNLKARSNGGYRLLLQSMNGGVLRHVDPSDDSRVPYTVIVDGNPVVLNGGETMVIVNSEMTHGSGRNHRLEVVVGATDDASAGDYRDVINVVIWSFR
jgi:hypothetical protein